MVRAAAKKYIDLGLIPIPIHSPIFDGTLLTGCSCGRAAQGCAPGGARASSIGKHPVFSAWQTVTLEESLAFFNKNDCNIGLLTGERSGIFALDVDPRHGGVESLEALVKTHGPLPATVTARTGSGGAHFVFKHPGFRVTGTQGVLGPGLDVRGDGNQIVVPPSRHRTGMPYEWIEGRAPGEIPFAAAPTWLLENLRQIVRDPLPRVSVEKSSALSTAFAAYLAEHPPKDWPMTPGTCPACKHNGCFRMLDRETEDEDPRWVCYSTNHGVDGLECGRQSKTTGVWWGDQLDLDAHAAGRTVVQLVREGGYLETSPQDLEILATLTRGEAATKPVIVCTPGDQHLNVAAGLEALKADKMVFERGSRLVTVWSAEGDDPKEGAIQRESRTPVVVMLSWSALAIKLTESASWVKYNKGFSQIEITPPDRVVSCIHDGVEPKGIPRLEGLVTSPILRPDGSVSVQAGYDPATRFFYVPQGAVAKIPDAPTLHDARMAAVALLEVVRDIPFAEEIDQAVWLAALLTIVGRGAYATDPVPMFVIDSTTPGTGKSLLCDTISLIATGHKMARSPYVREDDEMRKRILAHCIASDGCVLIDNVPAGARLGWPALELALTSSEIQDRILGESRIVKVPHRVAWFATGNNIIVAGDMGRRAIQCRLEPPNARPDQRTDFLHPHLLEWVRSERPRLLAAALTILRAYFVAGKPKQHGLAGYGSFHKWSDVVRAVLVWLGAPDVYERVASNNTEADPEESAAKDLLVGWQELDVRGQGLTVSAALQFLIQNPSKFERLRSAIQIVCPVRGSGDIREINPKFLGLRLRTLRGRWHSVNAPPEKVKELAFEIGSIRVHNAAVWRVKERGVA